MASVSDRLRLIDGLRALEAGFFRCCGDIYLPVLIAN
jgi:hypothetical protein